MLNYENVTIKWSVEIFVEKEDSMDCVIAGEFLNEWYTIVKMCLFNMLSTFVSANKCVDNEFQ